MNNENLIFAFGSFIFAEERTSGGRTGDFVFRNADSERTEANGDEDEVAAVTSAAATISNDLKCSNRRNEFSVSEFVCDAARPPDRGTGNHYVHHLRILFPPRRHRRRAEPNAPICSGDGIILRPPFHRPASADVRLPTRTSRHFI